MSYQTTSEASNQPLVSIIMNCYNGEAFVKNAIDSVFAQTYANWEIIFWDNASTDGTPQIASSFDSRLRYFRAAKNTPLGPARNLALKKAAGKYISFLDADDALFPTAIEKQVQLIESGDYALVYGGVTTVDETNRVVGNRKPRYRSGFILPQLLRHYDITMCSTMIRKSTLDDAGLSFDKRFAYCPDFNLFMKIAATHEVGTFPDTVVKYRRSEGSLTRKTLHLVSKEHKQTLDELELLHPRLVEQYAEAMGAARTKLHFYDCVYRISTGDYRGARAALRPAIGRGWQYLLIYLALLLPIDKNRFLKLLNR